MPRANTALSALAVLGVLSAGLRLAFALGIKRLMGLAHVLIAAKPLELIASISLLNKHRQLVD